jgi:hypothetical protein
MCTPVGAPGKGYECASNGASVCVVHLAMTTEADVFTICHAIKTILTNESSAHTVSRPPIFCSSRIQMARDLLAGAYKQDTAIEVVHVLPGSHNMFFKLHFMHLNSNQGACYQLLFCYRDKRPVYPDLGNRSACGAIFDTHDTEMSTTETSGKRISVLAERPPRRRKRVVSAVSAVSVASDSSATNSSDAAQTHPKRRKSKIVQG